MYVLKRKRVSGYQILPAISTETTDTKTECECKMVASFPPFIRQNSTTKKKKERVW